MPNRALETMDRHFRTHVQLLIKTCHRREIHAMGGMAAQIPIKNDPVANEKALDKVRWWMLREVKAGYDGTWVAHPPGALAKAIFDEYMKTPNQIYVKWTRSTSPPRICSKSPLARSPRTGCGSTSTWACNIWKRGCAATAASRSTT